MVNACTRGGKFTTEFIVPPPTAPFNALTDHTDPATIDIVAMGGQSYYFNKLWHRYVEMPQDKHRPEVLDAFVRGAWVCARGNCSILYPLISKAVAAPEIELTNTVLLERLALVIGDVGYESCGRALFKRCLGVKMAPRFYHALLKLAADSQEVVDMDFAFEVCEEMARYGLCHTGVSLQLIFKGIGRLSQVPFPMLRRIMDWRLANTGPRRLETIEYCFMHKFLSLIESVPGSLVPDAVQYLKELKEREPTITTYFIPEFESFIRPHQEGDCEDNKNIDFFAVDPFTMKIPDWYDNASAGAKRVPSMPLNTYAVFLYSSIRELCHQASLTAENHPLQKKRRYTLDLLRANPNSVMIVPLEEELCVRMPEEAAPHSVHDKFFSFLAGIAPTPCANCTVAVVTGDPAVARRAQRILPVTTDQLPFVAGGGSSVIVDEQVG